MDEREHGTDSPDFEEPEPLRVRRSSDLHDAGLTRRGVERELRTGRIERVRRGIYVPPTDDDEVRWRQKLAANLEYGGACSALSHRCAAYLHHFDGYLGLPIAERSEDLSVRRSSAFRTSPAIRVRQLDPTDVVAIAGFAVTSVRRTLADLGRFIAPDDVELALESALRLDPSRPDEWREPLLAELLTLVGTGGRGRTGLAALRMS